MNAHDDYVRARDVLCLLIKKREEEGWEVGRGFLTPPPDDPRKTWCALWTPVWYKNEMIRVPDWIGRPFGTPKTE